MDYKKKSKESAFKPRVSGAAGKTEWTYKWMRLMLQKSEVVCLVFCGICPEKHLKIPG